MRLKLITTILAVGAIPVTVIFIESAVRSHQGGNLPIDGLPIEKATVTGKWQPDFLWAGKAWWIEVESAVPLHVCIDGWQGKIPTGIHSLYSNHDHTNTGEFGDTEFWGFPKSIRISVIRSDAPRPNER
jgi:hypothetical protein